MASSTLRTGLMTSVCSGKTTKNYEYATKHAFGTGSLGVYIDYLYFSAPMPKGATITSAKLYLYTDAQTTGAAVHTITAKRLNKSVSMTKVTYKTRPTTYYATPAAVAVSKTAPFVAGTEWVLDVTAHMQAVANGEAWYGWELSGGATTNPQRSIYGPRWSTSSQRPRLEVVWAMLPGTPSSLSPGGGRVVSQTKPVLRATYVDIGADNPLAAVQVQRNDSSNDFSGAVTWDSGTVASNTPQLDTSLTSWPALTGPGVYWRMRVQDTNGLWSLWSSPELFGYDAKATVELVSPGAEPNNYVTEDSPPIVWNFPAVGPEKTTNGTIASLAYFTAFAGPSGVTAVTRIAGGAQDGTGVARCTWTTGTSAVSGAAGLTYSNSAGTADPGLTVLPGMAYDLRANVRASIGQTITYGVTWYDAAEAQISTTSTTQAVTANTWQALSYRTAAAPANAARARLIFYGTSAVWPTGSTLDVSNLSLLTADTSETQAAYQVFLIDPVDGRTLWTSGKVTSSSATGFSLPPGYLKTVGATYRVVVYVWDTKNREATPGAPTYAGVGQNFTYQLSNTVAPVTTMTATPDLVRPSVALTWSRSVFPDSFTILRDGVVIATELAPGDVATSGTAFAYVDPAPLVGVTATYQVAAVVNGRSSSGNATAAAAASVSGMWLANQDRSVEVLITGRQTDRAWTFGEQSEVLEVIGGSEVIVVTHAQRGLEGTISGQLRTGMFGLTTTAAQWKAALLTLKRKGASGETLLLTAGDATIPVVIRQVNVYPRAEPQLAYDVSFEFYQVAL